MEGLRLTGNRSGTRFTRIRPAHHPWRRRMASTRMRLNGNSRQSGPYLDQRTPHQGTKSAKEGGALGSQV